MTCARIRVKIHGSTQVILLPIDSDRGLRLGTFNCYFQAAKGIAYYNDAHAIVGLDFNDESRKFFPGPNEEWQENIDYFPTYANGQLTPPSANEAASSAITSCLTFDKDGLWDIRTKSKKMTKCQSNHECEHATSECHHGRDNQSDI
ncbi:unnamed protein product [Adineta ricciae]|uniref:Uncharacterized protein n=1 Tax=Adineta ricciae TaxID=249248 RepID=A0A813MET7_ADIRI|nr:unnamed protein product [Adineta ricciae]